VDTIFRLVDSHAHLEEIENLEDAIQKARSVGVMAIIGVGSDYQSNQKILQLSRDYRGFVYPALGLHPWYIKESDIERDLEFIEAHVDEIAGIGEVGLDYHKKVRALADKDLQKSVFRAILNIAVKHNKPALIHSRYAWKDALNSVEDVHLEKGVFHWYTGTSSVLREIVSQGYYISATPAVEYHEEHRRAVKEIPLDRLLLETDSPVVYGRGNDFEYKSQPADVLRSLKETARLRDVGEIDIAEITSNNALRLFNI